MFEEMSPLSSGRERVRVRESNKETSLASTFYPFRTLSALDMKTNQGLSVNVPSLFFSTVSRLVIIGKYSTLAQRLTKLR